MKTERTDTDMEQTEQIYAAEQNTASSNLAAAYARFRAAGIADWLSRCPALAGSTLGDDIREALAEESIMTGIRPDDSAAILRMVERLKKEFNDDNALIAKYGELGELAKYFAKGETCMQSDAASTAPSVPSPSSVPYPLGSPDSLAYSSTPDEDILSAILTDDPEALACSLTGGIETQHPLSIAAKAGSILTLQRLAIGLSKASWATSSSSELAGLAGLLDATAKDMIRNAEPVTRELLEGWEIARGFLWMGSLVLDDAQFVQGAIEENEKAYRKLEGKEQGEVEQGEVEQGKVEHAGMEHTPLTPPTPPTPPPSPYTPTCQSHQPGQTFVMESQQAPYGVEVGR